MKHHMVLSPPKLLNVKQVTQPLEPAFLHQKIENDTRIHVKMIKISHTRVLVIMINVVVTLIRSHGSHLEKALVQCSPC